MNLFLLSNLIILLGAVHSHPSIGSSFYIPNYNLLGEDLFGGYKFFKEIPPTCIKNEKIDVTIDKDLFYTSTKSFYKAISTHTSLSVELQGAFTMGATLDATTKSISENKRTVSGVTLDIHSTKSVEYLGATCAHKLILNDNVRKSFEKLPKIIKEPWLKSSWVEYQLFLDTYGSHIVKEVIYGSSMSQHCFAESSKSYNERQFAVKACVDFAGRNLVGKLGIKSCSGIKKEEISSVESLQTSSLLIVRGGSPETRAELHKTRSKELVNKLLIEANKTHQPIRYKYTAVWTLLQSKYIGTEHFDKAINLEAFYKGFLNYGCQYQVEKRTVLQKFIRLPKGKIPTYQCILAPEGCQTNNDCHYRAALKCECRGDSCVRYYKNTHDIGKEKTIAKINKDKSWYKQGCKLKLFKCYCKERKTHWKTVWGSSTEEMNFRMIVHERIKELLLNQERTPSKPREPPTLSLMDLDYY